MQGARKVIENWLASPPEQGQAPRQECFPPIVINITDGQHNGTGDPVTEVHNIQQLGTRQGKCLVFNCHFTHQDVKPSVFPDSLEELKQLNAETVKQLQLSQKTLDSLNTFAEQMWKMSSIVPGPLRASATRVKRAAMQTARAMGKENPRNPAPESIVSSTARCLAYNSDANILVTFLAWGTQA